MAYVPMPRRNGGFKDIGQHSGDIAADRAANGLKNRVGMGFALCLIAGVKATRLGSNPLMSFAIWHIESSNSVQRTYRSLRSFDRAMIQREQIVIPVAIRVSAQVRQSPRWADNTNVGAFPRIGIGDKEGIGLSVDAGDHLFASPFPASCRISEVRNVLMTAAGIRLCDASNLNVRHCFSSPFEF